MSSRESRMQVPVLTNYLHVVRSFLASRASTSYCKYFPALHRRICNLPCGEFAVHETEASKIYHILVTTLMETPETCTSNNVRETLKNAASISEIACSIPSRSQQGNHSDKKKSRSSRCKQREAGPSKASFSSILLAHLAPTLPFEIWASQRKFEASV